MDLPDLFLPLTRASKRGELRIGKGEPTAWVVCRGWGIGMRIACSLCHGGR